LTLSYSYSEGRIVEINSHSLFSKWFSESGKLVQKLFSAVHGMIENPDCFVIVMIGE
jgi:SpoVK/Ycf46/Vps4 family AAA+-type ATPase